MLHWLVSQFVKLSFPWCIYLCRMTDQNSVFFLCRRISHKRPTFWQKYFPESDYILPMSWDRDLTRDLKSELSVSWLPTKARDSMLLWYLSLARGRRGFRLFLRTLMWREPKKCVTDEMLRASNHNSFCQYSIGSVSTVDQVCFILRKHLIEVWIAWKLVWKNPTAVELMNFNWIQRRDRTKNMADKKQQQRNKLNRQKSSFNSWNGSAFIHENGKFTVRTYIPAQKSKLYRGSSFNLHIVYLI